MGKDRVMFELKIAASKSKEHTCTYKLFDKTLEAKRRHLDNLTRPEQL